MMKKLVIFSGAGMSQESGLPTFRGKDGLWESMDVEKVADRKAWYCGRRPDCRKRRQAVLDFINPIHRRILECRPNEAHLIAARLEEKYEVTVITQNGDDFHQRAGSTRVIHLHGEALKNASTLRPYIPLDIDPSDPDIRIGDLIDCITEKLKLSMTALATETADNIGTCIIDFNIHSADELRFVIRNVKEIEGVDEVAVQQRQ